MSHVVAVDIDLRQFAAWSSRDGMLDAETHLHGLISKVTSAAPDVLLLECASPHLYAPMGKVFKKQQSWVIYNSAMVSRLAYRFAGIKVLVSPSSTWTNGLPEKVRHTLVGAVEPVFPRAKGRHDLKDCQAMIWTYRQEPDRWCSLEDFLEML